MVKKLQVVLLWQTKEAVGTIFHTDKENKICQV
jgi:hypothetical protein